MSLLRAQYTFPPSDNFKLTLGTESRRKDSWGKGLFHRTSKFKPDSIRQGEWLRIFSRRWLMRAVSRGGCLVTEMVKGQSRDNALDVPSHPGQSPLAMGRPCTLSFVIHFLCSYHFIQHRSEWLILSNHVWGYQGWHDELSLADVGFHGNSGKGRRGKEKAGKAETVSEAWPGNMEVLWVQSGNTNTKPHQRALMSNTNYRKSLFWI